MTLIRETAMQYRRLLLSLAPMALLVSCSDQITQPGVLQNSGAPPPFAIVDGAHAGNAQFFFLPPLVPAPTYSGTFDPSQSPVVTVCELAGSTCGTTVASFSGSAVKLDLDTEAYRASWKTKDAGLDPAKTYRIQVLVGAQVLGHADVVVLSNGSQIKTVDKNQFVSVINGGVLQIRFRIEGGAVTPPGQWQNGDLVTYNQESWGGDPTSSAAAALLVAQFNARYQTGVVVGYTSGFLTAFTSAAAILNYLPQSGAASPLNSDLLDPPSSPSGVFGGFVLALQLDVDFSDSGHLSGTSGLRFGNLRLCGLTTTPAYNGMTVREFLGAMNTALGGGPAVHSYGDMAILTNEVSSAFEGGAVSPFAQAHLVNGACPGGWQNGDVISHTQVGWGDPSSAAGILLNAQYDLVYARTGGLLEIGIASASGFSILFTSASAILNYEPAQGAIGPLNADLVDPTSSASGAFGGEVLALQLNVDFSDSGIMRGTTGLPFGNLTLCNFTSLTALNGASVRSFLSMANAALGGWAATYPITDLFAVAEQLNAAFESGSPSSFAQAQLVNGFCP